VARAPVGEDPRCPYCRHELDASDVLEIESAAAAAGLELDAPPE
jgi:hypothetical protein